MDGLFLYGPPGSGKSTLGKLLARRLARPFVDLDAEIEKAADALPRRPRKNPIRIPTTSAPTSAATAWTGHFAPTFPASQTAWANNVIVLIIILSFFFLFGTRLSPQGILRAS